MVAERGANDPAVTRSGGVSLDEIPLHSTNLLTVLDADGVILYESPAIEHIYGYEQNELVGDTVAEYVHPDDIDRVMAAFRAVVVSDGETIEAVEYRHEQSDGSYLWVESVASANPTKAGNYVVNTRDISEQRERAQRLERANERLEEFAGVVSHDLRNPLNVAQARVQLASEEYNSAHLVDATEAHERMETLIDELLALARAGEPLAGTDEIELVRVVRDCWRTVPTDEATLSVESEQRLRADRSRLRQLVENLLRNAVEHAGRDVSVTVGETESGFYVEDDGPGIPSEERERVFDPGHSGSNQGTGLGLSIVESVAEAHGWEIRVTAGAEGGTRFEIRGVEFRE